MNYLDIIGLVGLSILASAYFLQQVKLLFLPKDSLWYVAFKAIGSFGIYLSLINQSTFAALLFIGYFLVAHLGELIKRIFKKK